MSLDRVYFNSSHCLCFYSLGLFVLELELIVGLEHFHFTLELLSVRTWRVRRFGGLRGVLAAGRLMLWRWRWRWW